MKPFALLVAGLKAKDPMVAGDAARLLGELGRVEAAPPLSQYVQHCHYHYKSTGLIALGQLGQKMSGHKRTALAQLLRQLVAEPGVHNDWYWYSYKSVRAAAALALLIIGDDGGAEFLQTLAEKKDDVFFCWFAPAILRLADTCPAATKLKSSLTVAAILDTGTMRTRHTEPGLLTMQAEALGILGGLEAIEPLLQLSRFQSRYVRGEAAASLLAASDSPAHQKHVEKMAAHDTTDFVRIRAALALAAKGQKKPHHDVVKAAASAQDPFDRAFALEGLGLLGNPEDATIALRQTRHKNAYVRQCALEALERMNAKKAQKAAAALLKDPSSRVRLQAAKVLVP